MGKHLDFISCSEIPCSFFLFVFFWFVKNGGTKAEWEDKLCCAPFHRKLTSSKSLSQSVWQMKTFVGIVVVSWCGDWTITWTRPCEMDASLWLQHYDMNLFFCDVHDHDIVYTLSLWFCHGHLSLCQACFLPCHAIIGCVWSICISLSKQSCYIVGQSGAVVRHYLHDYSYHQKSHCFSQQSLRTVVVWWVPGSNPISALGRFSSLLDHEWWPEY